LSDYRLHLPPEIVPATHKKVVKPRAPAPGGGESRGPPREGAYRPPRGDGDRGDYRKKEGAPGEFRPSFGVGRGAPRE